MNLIIGVDPHKASHAAGGHRLGRGPDRPTGCLETLVLSRGSNVDGRPLGATWSRFSKLDVS
jgi:hypothetical protein